MTYEHFDDDNHDDNDDVSVKQESAIPHHREKVIMKLTKKNIRNLS